MDQWGACIDLLLNERTLVISVFCFPLSSNGSQFTSSAMQQRRKWQSFSNKYGRDCKQILTSALSIVILSEAMLVVVFRMQSSNWLAKISTLFSNAMSNLGSAIPPNKRPCQQPNKSFSMSTNR